MSRRVRVGVNGYGVIGKRVADAVSLQDDMQLVGVADIVHDYRIRVAVERGYPVYASDPASASGDGGGRRPGDGVPRRPPRRRGDRRGLHAEERRRQEPRALPRRGREGGLAGGREARGGRLLVRGAGELCGCSRPRLRPGRLLQHDGPLPGAWARSIRAAGSSARGPLSFAGLRIRGSRTLPASSTPSFPR